MSSTIPTTEKLAQALSLAGAPKAMIDKATQGFYDDYKSPIAGNIIALVRDARAAGLEDMPGVLWMVSSTVPKKRPMNGREGRKGKRFFKSS